MRAPIILVSAVLLCVSCGGDDIVIPEPTNRTDTVQPDSGEEDSNPADGEDTGPVDTIADGDPTDVPVDTNNPDEVVVDEAPRLVNAFSRDGEEVVLRFSEDVEAESAAEVENYRITGSDNTELPITDITIDSRFAFLALDLSSVSINPDLTYEVVVRDVEDLTGNPIDSRFNRATVNQALYLNIIWHQHQPLYLDPNRDAMIGPWVRKHATKDYWDMTAILLQYPGIHLTVNLTSVLLIQNEFYVDRLGPYVDPIENTVDEEAFLAQWEGHTDAFIDLLLHDTPTPESASEEELGLFYADPWATVSTSDPIMQRFPEYVELRDSARDTYTQLDFAYLKVFFEVAWFDPDFLQGPVRLTNGWTVDLSDVVDEQSNGTYLLSDYYTDGAEDDAERLARLEILANRLLAENYKIMADVIPLHRSLLLNAERQSGRVEVITTPFFHPILPLISDTELARHAQPTDLLPSPSFSFPDDAFAQVALARRYYQDTFGQPVYGMWPGEGSVAEEIIGTLVDNEIQWIATDQRVLERSEPSGLPHHFPYLIDGDTVTGSGGSTDDELIVVFRDGPLSDNIGFAYQTLTGEVAADDFMTNVLAQAPRFGQPDRLLTVILDGENAWELYRHEHDGKGFHHALYRSLEESQEVGELVTVTPAEYLHGNLDRSVAAHPTTEQRELEPLWRGSWIDASYATWIGESEENLAWTYLLQARTDLERSGVPRPNPLAAAPTEDDPEQFAAYQAWNGIYAAEGSDWFWWYGQDQTSASNDDTPFDRAFRSHLTGMYEFMNDFLVLRDQEPFEVPDFGPIIQARAGILQGPFEEVPVVDGKFMPDESEWSAVGGSFFDNDSSGTASSLNDDIALVYYGYDLPESGEESVYVAVQFNEDLSEKLGTNYRIRFYTNYKHVLDPDLGTFEPDPQVLNTVGADELGLNFNGGGAGYMLEIDFSSGAAESSLWLADGEQGWTAVDSLGGIEVGGPVSGGRIIEVRFPWSALGMAFGDPFEFLVTASEGSTLVDQAPQLESRIIFDDVTNLIVVVFECDVTGDTVPLDTYTGLNTLPPPDGTGLVYITGNQPIWGDWWPNSLALRDDGESPDRVAGDGIWTRSFQFRPGLLLRWKYTIGVPTDEGRWSGTEEFPLTERGYTLPNTPGTVYLREIFADRPQPTGSTAPNTVVDIEE